MIILLMLIISFLYFYFSSQPSSQLISKSFVWSRKSNSAKMLKFKRKLTEQQSEFYFFYFFISYWSLNYLNTDKFLQFLMFLWYIQEWCIACIVFGFLLINSIMFNIENVKSIQKWLLFVLSRFWAQLLLLLKFISFDYYLGMNIMI